MAQSCNDPSTYLRTKGMLYVVDNCNQATIEICKISNLAVSLDNEPIQPETPDGCVLFSIADSTASISFDLYSAGNFPLLGYLFQGIVKQGYYDGTQQVDDKIQISFEEEGCCCLLPAEDATINAINSLDGLAAYVDGTDYTTSVDPVTGFTFVCHVAGGNIEIGCPVDVDYSFVPAEGHNIVQDETGVAKPYDMIVVTECDCDSDEKIIYYLPDMLIQGSITQTLIRINSNNTDVTPISITATQQKESGCSKGKTMRWFNSCHIDDTQTGGNVLSSVTK